jgi:uncharacterized membrane protein YhaH (DUF805 family)
MFEPYKRYFDFQGRSSRKEYWMFYLLFVIVSVVASVLMAATGSPDGMVSMLVMALLGIFVLGSFIPSLAVSFRRLHDTDRSAWWLLIALLPFIGGLVLLVFNVLPGTPGDNRYGPSPLTTQKLQETFA